MLEACPTSLDDTALGTTWAATWSALCRPAQAGLQAEPISAKSEPQRYFHDQQQLRECPALGTWYREHSPCADEVAIAPWFHDAIYDLQSSVAGSSDLDGAAQAAQSLLRAGTDSDRAQRAYDMVMATRHDTSAVLGSSPDEGLFLDIGLSILGSPAERFKRYDQDVRQEYAWVAGFRYQKARAQVLQSLLDRPRLYQGEHSVTPLEAQARINLAAVRSCPLWWLAQ